jgi:hypothetical protein
VIPPGTLSGGAKKITQSDFLAGVSEDPSSGSDSDYSDYSD